MTVVDVTGGVLGSCCQVMLIPLVFKFPPIAEVTFFRKKCTRGLPKMHGDVMEYVQL